MAQRDVFDIINSGSPYLKGLLEAHPEFAQIVVSGDADSELNALISHLADTEDATSRSDAMHRLRVAKQKLALLVAIYDLSGRWKLEQVTTALTRFADAAVQVALAFLWRQEQAQKHIISTEIGIGYLVLAMGKMGAFELNYSSDIDLIVFFDPDRVKLGADVEPYTFFVKLTQALVALLQNTTADGYVFRTDLRLRPDPRATQVAIHIEAAATYYETRGQNWERAAMIKARPCAGDMQLGAAFIERLQPYIWRKYLDFAAIADIQSMKRQIHAVKGHGEIAVLGHNLKLGRGGIREIEFFAQTQQLIAGGRNAALRLIKTCDALDALAAFNWISPQTAAELKDAYAFLRRLEHRAQMVEDQQTHDTPSDPVQFENYARFSGFANSDDLSQKLEATLRLVQGHYAALFEQAGNLASETGSLVFTGGEDDPATLETLRRMGYAQVSEVAAIIRSWHFGRYRAMRTERARELLTELMPALLKALAENGEADQALFAFDKFLESLSSGVQFLSMLRANPRILALITQILGAAPRLAEKISAQPRILEAVIAPDFFSGLPPRTTLINELANQLGAVPSLEEAMDFARVFAREKNFRVGVRILSETTNADEAGRGFSDIAEAVLNNLLKAVLADIKRKFGEINGGACALVGMGKLGGHEMTATSDLDIMLVYDHAEGEDSGTSKLAPAQYYAKVTQSFVTALSAPTTEGRLYDVDMRLRPSGSKGPLAVSFAAFESYQRNEAWTWEHMALTRARVIAGEENLSHRITSTMHSQLTQKRDAAKTLSDITTMRALMLKEHKPGKIWDLKRASGGQVDIEFIAQGLELLHAHQHPEILNANTSAALRACAKAELLTKSDADFLIEALGLYQRLTHVLRLCIDGEFNPANASIHLRHLLAQAAAEPDLSATEALLADMQEKVALIFVRLLSH